MILWAKWKARDDGRFKIPFSSWPQAKKWLRSRGLLGVADLEWDSGRLVHSGGGSREQNKKKRRSHDAHRNQTSRDGSRSQNR